MRSCSCSVRSSVRLGGSRVKIEYVIAARPTSFPRYPPSEKKNRQANALAAGRRDILHGVWRDVWHRTNCTRRRIWARDFDFAADAGAVELAHRVHDWRAFERVACRGRLLRLGAARAGKFLGISGSVAVAGG